MIAPSCFQALCIFSGWSGSNDSTGCFQSSQPLCKVGGVAIFLCYIDLPGPNTCHICLCMSWSCGMACHSQVHSAIGALFSVRFLLLNNFHSQRLSDLSYVLWLISMNSCSLLLWSEIHEFFWGVCGRMEWAQNAAKHTEKFADRKMI